MAEPPAPDFESPRDKAVLWFTVLSGPLAWFAHLAASYALAASACGAGHGALVHLATLLALGLLLPGAWVGWRALARLRRHPGLPPDVAGRSRLMALSGLALNLYFLAVVLLGEVASWVYGPCS